MLQSLWNHAAPRGRLTRALAVMALAAGLSGAAVRATPLPANAQTAATELVYLGTQGRQLHALRFDPASGKLAMVGVVAQGLRATWTVAHPRLPILYAVNDDNAEEGTVTAFTIDRASGALSKINEVATGGKGTTYLWLDLPSLTLLAANYAGGSASSIALNGDGSLGARVSTIAATGSGPHRRQVSAHAHSVAIDPSGRYALVPDMGADRVFVYGFERAGHALSPDDAASPRSFSTPAGSGPRHLVFGLNGHYLYLINELTAEVMTLRWDAQRASLTLVQSLQTSSPEFGGAKSGAEVALSRDGRFVYVENRGENMLLVYRVDRDTGELSLLQRIASGGEAPWGLAIHPSGKWMLVAHQRSNTVRVFGVEPASGLLTDTGQAVEAPTPVSVTFVK